MRDLGTLGGRDSVACGINDVGQVVGTSKDASGRDRPFLWETVDGVESMIDLNDLVALNPGWNLTNAYAINNQGHIAVVGNTDILVGAFLLSYRAE